MAVAQEPWMEEMRREAQRVRDRQENKGGGDRRWSLYGEGAIVKAGGTGVIRLLPHTSYKDRFVVKAGKRVENSKYIPQRVYLRALEHWWDKPSGGRDHEWCPKTFGDAEQCALCEISDELRATGVKADEQQGYDLRGKETFLYVAVVGKTGERHMKDDGAPDIRVLPLTGTLFMKISDLMTGGADGDTAYGNVADPVAGYDLKLTRPAAGAKGQRWEVVPLPHPSRLYDKEEAEAWKGWLDMIPDIGEAVRAELKDPEAVRARFYGEAPASGGNGLAVEDDLGAPAAADDMEFTPAAAPSVEDDPAPPELWDDDDLTGAAPAAPPARQAAPARKAPPAPAPRRTPPPPQRRGR